MDRFWSKVDKRGDDDCWLWKATVVATYGQIQYEGRRQKAHRVAWILTKGPLPAGWNHKSGVCVLHSCDNRLCVNPRHLFLGTNTNNNLDMTAKGRRVRGSRVGTAKLTDVAVRDIRARRRDATMRQLADEYGVNVRTVRGILDGLWWAHVVNEEGIS